MIYRSESALSEIFSSFQQAFSANLFQKPLIGVLFIVILILIFILSAIYTVNIYLNYIKRQKELKDIYKFLTKYMGLTQYESENLKKLLIKKNQSPFYRPLLYESLFKRYVSPDELKELGLDYDRLFQKCFRLHKDE